MRFVPAILLSVLVTTPALTSALTGGTGHATPPPPPAESRAAALHAAAAADTVHTAKGVELIGPLTRDQWLAFAPALRQEYRDYRPQQDLIDALAAAPREVTLVCVLGTWCSDSRREVPRLWKVLDDAANPGFTLLMFAAGRGDDTAAAAWEKSHHVTPGYRRRFGVERVPTLIVLEDGRERGRIVETPEVSWEADLARILDVKPSPRWH